MILLKAKIVERRLALRPIQNIRHLVNISVPKKAVKKVTVAHLHTYVKTPSQEVIRYGSAILINNCLLYDDIFRVPKFH